MPTRNIHRIGGGSIANLRLKPAEKTLNPPGISVLQSETPGEAAEQMRNAFPSATRLHELTKVVGSTSEELVRAAGFDLKPDGTSRFPNHFRITHPAGAAGFSDENLRMLSEAFVDTTE